jgi:hypothetical protein
VRGGAETANWLIDKPYLVSTGILPRPASQTGKRQRNLRAASIGETDRLNQYFKIKQDECIGGQMWCTAP